MRSLNKVVIKNINNITKKKKLYDDSQINEKFIKNGSNIMK